MYTMREREHLALQFFPPFLRILWNPDRTCGKSGLQRRNAFFLFSLSLQRFDCKERVPPWHLFLKEMVHRRLVGNLLHPYHLWRPLAAHAEYFIYGLCRVISPIGAVQHKPLIVFVYTDHHDGGEVGGSLLTYRQIYRHKYVKFLQVDVLPLELAEVFFLEYLVLWR